MRPAISLAPRPALVTAGLAVAGAGVVGAMAVAGAETDVRSLASVAAVGGAVALVLGVVSGWTSAIGWGVAGLAASYACALAGRDGGLDGRAPVIGAALFLVAELAYWSSDLRRTPTAASGLVARRIALLAAVAAGSVAVGGAVLALATIDPGWGLTAETAGVVAAVGLAGTAVVAARANRV